MTDTAEEHPTDDLPPVVRIRCPECGTETTVDSDEARETLHTHDEKRHDGERTAGLKVRTDNGFIVLPHPDDVVADGGVDQSTRTTDQYDTLLRSMKEGLLLTINNTAYAGTPSFELRVEDSRDDETRVSLSGPGESCYRIHRDRRGKLIYSEITENGLSYEDEISTIEVVGIDERSLHTDAEQDDEQHARILD